MRCFRKRTREVHGAPRATRLPRAASVLLAAAFAFATAATAAVAAPAAPAAPRRRVTDDAGRAVEIPQPVRRIVSLAPSVTETLFAIGAGNRIVGDTNYCVFPPEARQRPHIGGPVDPSIEKIAALHPDLVVAARSINRLVTVHSLEQLGIPTYVTDARTVEQVVDSAEKLSGAVNADGRSAALAMLRARLQTLRAALSGVQPKRVFFVVWQTPLISVGQDTFLADALRWAGARSVLNARQDWPQVSLEEVVRLQPDYLIFSSDEPQKIQRTIAELHDKPGWRDLQAMRGGRIIVLSEAIQHPSPRLLDVIEQLARALYPERFPAPPAGAR